MGMDCLLAVEGREQSKSGLVVQNESGSGYSSMHPKLGLLGARFHGMEEVIGSILTSKSKYLANPTFSQNGSCHRWNQVLVQRTDVFQVRQFYLAYRLESR